MYLSNYHSHCTFCDGRSHPEVFVQHAISKGLQSFGFSSHAPLPFTTTWTMKEDDVEEYFQELARLKEKYKGQIELYAGLETDYLNEHFNANNAYFAAMPSDYIISSIHYITNPDNGELIAVDGSYAEFEQEVKKHFNNRIDDVLRIFFDQSIKMVKTGGFEIVGHADKIYLNSRKFPGFANHQSLMDALMDDYLAAIAKSGVILEINCKSLDALGFTYPHQRYYERIKTLNIPITINCDSHNPDNVLQGKIETGQMLRESGFSHTMELMAGKWQPQLL